MSEQTSTHEQRLEDIKKLAKERGYDLNDTYEELNSWI